MATDIQAANAAIREEILRALNENDRAANIAILDAAIKKIITGTIGTGHVDSIRFSRGANHEEGPERPCCEIRFKHDYIERNLQQHLELVANLGQAFGLVAEDLNLDLSNSSLGTNDYWKIRLNGTPGALIVGLKAHSSQLFDTVAAQRQQS